MIMATMGLTLSSCNIFESEGGPSSTEMIGSRATSSYIGCNSSEPYPRRDTSYTFVTVHNDSDRPFVAQVWSVWTVTHADPFIGIPIDRFEDEKQAVDSFTTFPLYRNPDLDAPGYHDGEHILLQIYSYCQNDLTSLAEDQEGEGAATMSARIWISDSTRIAVRGCLIVDKVCDSRVIRESR